MTLTRNNNIDLIKLYACICVVALHTISKDLSSITTVIYYLSGVAVPLFFMSSGYFLLNRGEISIKYSIHKIIGIFRIVVLWNLIFYGLEFIWKIIHVRKISFSISSLIQSVFQSLVQKDELWHFWYLGALMLIYVALPILSKIIRKNGYKRVILVFLSICICLELYSLCTGYPVQKYVIQTFRIWTWELYFLLGGIFGQGYSKVSGKDYEMRIHAIVLIAVTILNIVYQLFVGLKVINIVTGRYLNAEYFYDSSIEILWIALLFSFVLRLKLKPGIVKVVKVISPLTMGVYILHPIVLKFTSSLFARNSVLSFILLYVVTFGGALVGALFIKVVRLDKYLMKI